jgi:hypothetical protein
MFLRFVVTQIDDDSRQPQGLFAAAHDLLDSGDLARDEYLQLREVLIWLNKNLPSPRVQRARAIFWFKSEANECIDRMWNLVNLLRFHGYLVEIQKYRGLGKIFYEDDFQVAAAPSKSDRK